MKSNEGKYLLNAVELNIAWNDTWQIHEIDISEWDKDKDYDAIVALKNYHEPEKFLLESHGRYIVLIPKGNHAIIAEDIDKLREILEKSTGRQVSFKRIGDPLKLLNDDEDGGILNVIRKGLGEIISEKIASLGFEKVGSGGGIGVYSFPKNWLGDNHHVQQEKAKIIRVFDFTILPPEGDTKAFFLAADVKGRFIETHTLQEWLDLDEQRRRSFSDWKKADKIWQLMPDARVKKLFSKEIEQEDFEIKEFTDCPAISDRELGFGRYGKTRISDLIAQGLLPTKQDAGEYLIVKPIGRVIKDPNKQLLLPVRFFYRHSSQPVDEEHENEFKRFTQLTPAMRYKYISAIFDVLNKDGISKPLLLFQNHVISFAAPGVGSTTAKEYGRVPPLVDTGVELWGNLKRVDIFYSERIERKISEFAQLLQENLAKIKEKTSARLKVSIPDIEITKHPLNTDRFINDQLLGSLDGKCCPVIVTDRYIKNYKEFKKKFTQERCIPVQVIEADTIFQSRNLVALVRTLIPQMLVKAGGMPYKLSPAMLDRTIIVGLDKARDSSMQRPSASAGIAAVTPDGQYVSGASTELENNTTDFINVDKLAPVLLRELEEHKYGKDYDYVVILRDGSPRTCKQEVPAWRKHLEAHGKRFIFIASRKTHAFRVFPASIDDQPETSRVNYSVPAVLNGAPLP
ncbi:MAG: hypothetical protein GYA24_24885, partial [Candidatus Lokiarchaeota archaeon]|nr:hypothetical protein [Candidatus Lokiarchaeota archaeon]